jgi:hypothetical protein
MAKINKIVTMTLILLSLLTSSLLLYSLDLSQQLIQKSAEINSLSNKLMQENQALDQVLDNQQKPSLVTALGVSVEPRNDTLYPHPHFTFEGYVFNIGNRTAYHARLEITAFFKKGELSAFNLTMPLGDLGRYQIVRVSKIVASSDWIGNYTIVPLCEDNP